LRQEELNQTSLRGVIVKMGEEGMIGGEFISLVNLIVNAQTKLKIINKSNQLLECKIKKTGDGLSYSSKFGERYQNIPLNRALEMYYSQLKLEINKYELGVKNA
jgi:hypothetical protein